MADNDDDLREIEEIIKQPGDAALDADGDSPEGSLTNDEGKDPRKAFLDQFTGEGGKPPSEEDLDEDSDEELDTDVKPPDDDSEDTDESKPKPKDDESDKDDSDDDKDEDDDDEDLDIDFSDLELDNDEDAGPSDFDARQDLSKKVWKSTPPEAQELISSHRKHAKRLERDIKQDAPYSKWSRDLFEDAKKANTSNEQLMGLIEAGFRLNTAASTGKADAEAAAIFGGVALANGFRFETESPELALEDVHRYMQEQIDGMNLDVDVAKGIMKAVRGAADKHKETLSQATQKAAPVAPERGWTDPENNGMPIEQSDAVRNAAVQKISTMTQRFAKRFGNDWPKLEERIKQEVVLQQQATPLPATHWPKLWKEAAEKVSKQFLKRSKERKGKSRLNSNSESLGRGESVAAKNDDGSEKSARSGFLDKYTT